MWERVRECWTSQHVTTREKPASLCSQTRRRIPWYLSPNKNQQDWGYDVIKKRQANKQCIKNAFGARFSEPTQQEPKILAWCFALRSAILVCSRTCIHGTHTHDLCYTTMNLLHHQHKLLGGIYITISRRGSSIESARACRCARTHPNKKAQSYLSISISSSSVFLLCLFLSDHISYDTVTMDTHHLSF